MAVAIINGDNDKGANKWEDIDTETLIKNKCSVKHFSHEGGHKIATSESTDSAIKWLNEEWKK